MMASDRLPQGSPFYTHALPVSPVLPVVTLFPLYKHALDRLHFRIMDIDIPSVGEELDEDNIEPLCEKQKAKKDKIRSKNRCFEYVLHKYENKKQLEWQINEVYEQGTLISYLVYT
jgi:hypothetical protein